MADIVLDTDDLEITVQERGETNLASSLGSGTSIVGTKSGVTLRFKSLVAGNNITLSNDSNSVTIANNMDFGNVTEHLLPSASNTHDVGASANTFKDLFLNNFDIQYQNSRTEITSNTAYWDSSDSAVEIDTGAADLTLRTDASNNVVVPQNLVVNGSLDVNGTLTTIDTTNLAVSDKIIELNRGATSNTTDIAIIMERGSTGDNATLFWDESEDVFKLGTTTSAGDATGDLAGVTLGNLNINELEVGDISTQGVLVGDFLMQGVVGQESTGMQVDAGDAGWAIINMQEQENGTNKPYNVPNPGINFEVFGGTTASPAGVSDQRNLGALFFNGTVDGTGNQPSSAAAKFSCRTDDDQSVERLSKFDFDMFREGGSNRNNIMSVRHNKLLSNNMVEINAFADDADDNYVNVLQMFADFSNEHTTAELEANISNAKTVMEFWTKTDDNEHHTANIEGSRTDDTYHNLLRLWVEDDDDNGFYGQFTVHQNSCEFGGTANLLQISSGTTDPSDPEDGDWFFNRTSGSVALKRYNGSSWVSEPGKSGNDGAQFYDRSQDKVIVRINGAWHEQSTSAI